MRSTLNYQQEQYELLIGLIADSRQLTDNSRQLMHFQRFFDKVRNPRFSDTGFTELPLLRLELGALQEFVFLRRDQVVNWDRVIDAISW
jgi:hypothetical protein